MYRTSVCVAAIAPRASRAWWRRQDGEEGEAKAQSACDLQGGVTAGRLQKNGVYAETCGGEEEDRTPDLRIANAALSQLSYPPTRLS